MLGGGNVNFIPISMSLATTFFSAIAVLGIPAEFYIYGTMYTYFLVPYLICTILSAEVFGPIYMDMGVTSTYEYLEVSVLNFVKILIKIQARFHKSVKLMATLTYVCQNIIYVGMAIFRMNSRLEAHTLSGAIEQKITFDGLMSISILVFIVI